MTSRIVEIPVSQIIPNPEQPRKSFNKEKLSSLAESIRRHGLITAISVEATSKPDVFILEDGERRWRAHKLAGLQTIRAEVKPPSTGKAQDRLSKALIANLHRADMNPVEEGKAFLRLREEFKWPLIKIVRVSGCSQPRVMNRLAIAALEPEIQSLIVSKRFPKDQRAIDALLSIKKSKARIKFAIAISEKRGMSIAAIVRAVAKLNELLEDTKHDEFDPAPAITYGIKKAKNIRPPIWKQMAERGEVPRWEIVKASAEEACRKCPFYEKPSESVCGKCPAVNLVANMVRVSRAIKA